MKFVKIALMKNVAGPGGSTGIDVQSDMQNSQGSKPSEKKRTFPPGKRNLWLWCN